MNSTVCGHFTRVCLSVNRVLAIVAASSVASGMVWQTCTPAMAQRSPQQLSQSAPGAIYNQQPYGQPNSAPLPAPQPAEQQQTSPAFNGQSEQPSSPPLAAQAQQSQQYLPSAPPSGYFSSNVPPASGGGYTGYGGEPSYYQSPDYRYTPANPYYQPPWPNYSPAPYAVRPRFAYAPAGLVLPVTLQTPVSTQVAGQGDVVQADLAQNVPLQGLSFIPAGSQLVGQVSEAQGGRLFNRSGSLALTFDQLRLPDGRTIPVQAHILGDIGKYSQKNGEVHGEGWGTKLGSFALRAAIGAGSGAVLGTALGAIASRGGGYGIGTGAWAGTAIGGGIGVLDDLVARRGRNVLIRSGTPMQVQLDAPIQIPQDQTPNPGQQQFGGGSV